jgi:hypothetical protein
MVFANPNWFTRRKYGGWGLGIKSWQGIVYILGVLAPFAVFQMLPYWSSNTRLIVTGIWILFLSIEVIDIMRKLNKDEREKIHEAIAERNALWGVMTVLVIAMLYQIFKSALIQTIDIDWWIVIALFAGMIIKTISNYRLEKEN